MDSITPLSCPQFELPLTHLSLVPPSPASSSTTTTNSASSSPDSDDISKVHAFQRISGASKSVVKWRPRTSRLENIMNDARKRAEQEHRRREQIKSKNPYRKPTKAITPRQKSSKRSAEICRAKMGIYINMVEDQVKDEQKRGFELNHALLLQTKLNADLLNRIIQLRMKKSNQTQTQQQQKQQVQEESQFEEFQRSSSFYSDVSSAHESTTSSLQESQNTFVEDEVNTDTSRTINDNNDFSQMIFDVDQTNQTEASIADFDAVMTQLDSPVSPVTPTENPLANDVIQEPFLDFLKF